MTRLFKLINISGRDSVEFLQGQLTQDLQRLAASSGTLPAAWCNPQGRVIGTMRLIAQKDSLELVVPATLAEAMVERFLLYRLRAAVDFRIEGDDWRAFAVSDAQDLESLARLKLLPEAKLNAACRGRGLVAVETGARPRTVEIYGPAAAFQDTELSLPGALSDDAWQRALITAGVPLIGADASEKYTPHMLNLDRLGAVSFDKGCYTGQEIVARTEYRGKSRRRLMHYRTETPAASVGNRLADGEREAGNVVNVVGTDLLAVVPRDLHTKTLAVAGVPATPVPLPYDL